MSRYDVEYYSLSLGKWYTLTPALTLANARIEHGQVSAKGIHVRIVTHLRGGRKLVVRQ